MTFGSVSHGLSASAGAGLAGEAGVGGLKGLPNRRMKQTRLSAAPGWLYRYQTRGAASCPRRQEAAGTASQLIRGVGRTLRCVAAVCPGTRRYEQLWPRQVAQ
jgi:hypothetical protein